MSRGWLFAVNLVKVAPRQPGRQKAEVRGQIAALAGELGRNFRDLVPILLVVAFFQLLVVGEPMEALERRLGGAFLALLGMTFFVRGLSMSLFPLGDELADGLTRRGSILLLLAFSFALGFGSTVAEPALAAVANQAADAVAGGAGEAGDKFSRLLRYSAAAAVGAAMALGVFRIVKGWPAIWLVLPGYALAAVLALWLPDLPAGIAFDAGAAATSAINIPLIIALGVGLASLIGGRNPLVDGFGLVALSSLAPMLVMLIFLATSGS